MESITSSYEIARFSIVGREYPLTTISKLKGDIERTVFNTCLGFDLYELMKANVVSHSGVIEWADTTTYGVGDLIFYYDTVFESKIAGNINKNPKHDQAEQFWKVSNKFSNENYQFLYSEYLRDILANMTIKECLAIDSIQMSGKGLTMSATPDQHGAITADTKTIEYQLRHIQSIIDRKIELMNTWLVSEYKKYLKDNSTGYDWSVIPFVKDECKICEMSQGKGRRRMIMRSERY